MSQTHTLTRECRATMIPAGDVLTLPKDTEVFIVQTLGGNITVRTDRGLFRIAREDAAAIGGYTPPAESAASDRAPGEFSEQAVWDALKTCFDPEIPVNVVDLGLIYDCKAEKKDDGSVSVLIRMTLTAPGCGMGPTIAADARQKILAVEGVDEAEVELVWDPPWSQSMISEEGRMKLGLV